MFTVTRGAGAPRGAQTCSGRAQRLPRTDLVATLQGHSGFFVAAGNISEQGGPGKDLFPSEWRPKSPRMVGKVTEPMRKHFYRGGGSAGHGGPEHLASLLVSELASLSSEKWCHKVFFWP